MDRWQASKQANQKQFFIIFITLIPINRWEVPENPFSRQAASQSVFIAWKTGNIGKSALFYFYEITSPGGDGKAIQLKS